MLNEITSKEFGKLMSSRKNFKLINIITDESEDFMFTPRTMLVRPDSIESKIPQKLSKQDLIVIYSKRGNMNLIQDAAIKLLSLGYKHLIIYPGL
jgi:hypothetical protein